MTASPAGSVVNITETIDNSQVRSFQIGIFVLCGLCLIMDGFDVQAWGYVAPSLFGEWGIPSAAGRVASVTLIGVLIGSLLFSMLADKIGRRPVLIGATLYFSALTLVTAQVTTLDQLLIIRLIAGLGLGAIMPNAVALVGEYSPRRSRVMAMLVVSNGFTIGAAVAGFIATYLIPRFGWRSVFYFGGTVPLRHRPADVRRAARVAAVPDAAQEEPRQGQAMAETRRAVARDDAGHAVRRERREEGRRADRHAVSRGPRRRHTAALDDAVHEPDQSVHAVDLAADDRARHGDDDDGGADGGDDVSDRRRRGIDRDRTADSRNGVSSAC